MNKFVSIVSSIALVAASSFATMAPVQAAGPGHRAERDRMINNYCRHNPRDRDCRDFRSHHGRWNDRQYQSFYHRHRGDRDFGGAAIAGIFGLAAGAIIAGAANSDNYSSRVHIRACEARFRSYDVRSDTYLGYDGNRHRCTL